MTKKYIPGSKSAAFEDAENHPSNTSTNIQLGEIIQERYSRRQFLQTAGVVAAGATLSTVALNGTEVAHADSMAFVFNEISHGVDQTHHVAPGYRADVLLRWGDPLFADSPVFNPYTQTADDQEKQFGYNNDFVGYLPLNGSTTHGLLAVNHEYTNEELMFPGLGRQDVVGFVGMKKEIAEIEMAAMGMSVVEVKKDESGSWKPVVGSPYNRRITPRSTAMQLSGPAAGDERMKTSADPTGRAVIGTLNNCAGGITPWGTVLTAEENFNGYFWGDAAGHTNEKSLKRYGAPARWYNWGQYDDRFDVNKEPNEINRFGWIVEVDPYDPNSTPVKRTALGRFKHEGANPVINSDGRVVVYMGDDQRFDYLYKFVSSNRYVANDAANNRDLLDHGTLFVAKFDAAGKTHWLPLVWETGPLTEENGFSSQADVLIHTRLAADLLGATPMDRPEDVEPNLLTNKVYVLLTNNSNRTVEQVDAPNPRGPNDFGQIIELTPPGGDHGATEFDWEMLVQCGNPSDAGVNAKWGAATSENGWFAAPDNCAIDHHGRLWVATDQGKNWSKSGTADGLWALEASGENRGSGKMFFRTPIGAELCGPSFTGDSKALFVAVQHPASDGARSYPGFARDSTFEDPATRWPDFDDKVPPRPSVVVITKDDGGEIGV